MLCPFGWETYAHDERSHNKQEQVDGGTYSHSISEPYGTRKEVVEQDGMYYGTLKLFEHFNIFRRGGTKGRRDEPSADPELIMPMTSGLLL